VEGSSNDEVWETQAIPHSSPSGGQQLQQLLPELV
jgi:hypothetical protein